MQHGVKGLCYNDQTIEDINIFSSAFLVGVEGDGSTYPTLP